MTKIKVYTIQVGTLKTNVMAETASEAIALARLKLGQYPAKIVRISL